MSRIEAEQRCPAEDFPEAPSGTKDAAWILSSCLLLYRRQAEGSVIPPERQALLPDALPAATQRKSEQ